MGLLGFLTGKKDEAELKISSNQPGGPTVGGSVDTRPIHRYVPSADEQKLINLYH